MIIKGIRSGKQYLQDKLMKDLDISGKNEAQKKGILKGADYIQSLYDETYNKHYQEIEKNIFSKINKLGMEEDDKDILKTCYSIFKRTKKHRIKEKQYRRTFNTINKYEGIKAVESYTYILDTKIKRKYRTVSLIYIEEEITEEEIDTLEELAFLYMVNFHSLKIEINPEGDDPVGKDIKEMIEENVKWNHSLNYVSDVYKGFENGLLGIRKNFLDDYVIRVTKEYEYLGRVIAEAEGVSMEEGIYRAKALIKQQPEDVETAVNMLSELIMKGYNSKELYDNPSGVAYLYTCLSLSKTLGMAGVKISEVMDNLSKAWGNIQEMGNEYKKTAEKERLKEEKKRKEKEIRINYENQLKNIDSKINNSISEANFNINRFRDR